MAGAVFRFGSRSGGIGAGLRQYTPEGYAGIPWEYCNPPAGVLQYSSGGELGRGWFSKGEGRSGNYEGRLRNGGRGLRDKYRGEATGSWRNMRIFAA